MIITRGESKRIDFSMQMQVTDDQVEQLIKFLKTIYHPTVVKEEHISEEKEFRTKRLGDRPRPDYPTWTKPEYLRLLDVDIINENEIAEQIGRTPTAIYMRRGPWIVKFMDWAGERNIYENTEELVKEFMDHLQKEKLERRELRKEQRKQDKQKKLEKEKLERRLHSLEQTVKIQVEDRERFPDKKAQYDEGILKNLAEIEKIKIELEEYDNDSQLN